MAEVKGKLGPFAAGILVAGNMIGSGVFLLPATLAGIGSISVVGWVVTTLGVMVLALVFAALARLRPEAPGLTGYVREGVGPFLGFQTLGLYWASLWSGNVAIAVAAAGYLTSILQAGAVSGHLGLLSQVLAHPAWGAAAAGGFVVLMVLVNMVGPRLVARLGGLTMLLGLLPILAVAVLGWAWFDLALFQKSWNVSGQPFFGAVQASVVQIVWAFLGVESAAVAARTVRDPERNIARATIGGVAVASVIYIAASAAIFGLLPAGDLAKSTAPFADAVRVMLGAVSGLVIAACALLKAVGALGGWVLCTAETAETAAEERLFPPIFIRKAPGSPPRANLLINMGLMLTVALLTASPTIAKTFNDLINISVVLSTLAYFWSCVALLRLGWSEPKNRLWAFVGLAFCAWVIVAALQDPKTLMFTVAALVLASALYLLRPLWAKKAAA
ncbi:MAG: amino acid permease [Proteobacteria bacterium]|nr:amino acid permease [Pseudomonadota bacterium]